MKADEMSPAFRQALRDINDAGFQPPACIGPDCVSGPFRVLLRTLEMQRRVMEDRDASPS